MNEGKKDHSQELLPKVMSLKTLLFSENTGKAKLQVTAEIIESNRDVFSQSGLCSLLVTRAPRRVPGLWQALPKDLIPDYK